MRTDYNENELKNKQMQGVMDGAPAYQVEQPMYVMPDEIRLEERVQEKKWGKAKHADKDMTWGGEANLEQTEVGDKTLEDYLALPDERRVEMIDGVFYDMAAPTLAHQDIAGSIYAQLRNFVAKNGGSCKPYISPVDVQLDRDDKTMVQPDVIVMCNREQITKVRIVGAPSLVVEVLSPSSRYMDMVRKFKKYKNAGVAEYWMVLPEEQKVLVYLFGEDTGAKSNLHAEGDMPMEYTFTDKVPVGIWDNKCEVNFAEIACFTFSSS